MTIALKSLLQQRHLHEYSEFVVEYEWRAKELDLPRHASAPTKAQYYRWVGGHIQNLPRGYHCLVLERMFPGWTARELFGHIDSQHAATTNEALFASFAPAVGPAQLAGLWVTCYVFDGTKHHLDLSTITVANNAVTARNYPPEPRAEAHASGFRNEIEAGLFGRHLIGRWRNISDTYFYGSLHFAVLPGETMLDGYYTGFLSDSQVVAERWRWVRVEPQSAEGVDVNTVVLGEPRRIYDAIVGRSPFDAPIPLEQLTENP